MILDNAVRWWLSVVFRFSLDIVVMQEEPKEESDDDMGFSLFD